MSTVTISSVVILNGNLICDGDITLQPSGKIIPVPGEVMDSYYVCNENNDEIYLCGNGKSRYIRSTAGNIIINGLIDGDGYGFNPDHGPGCNSILTNQLGHTTRGYGATHAGRGHKNADPGITGIIVDEFTLDQDNIDNRYVRLSGLPDNPHEVALNIIGAAAQYYPEDYYVVFGNLLNWAGTPLEAMFEIGDEIRVIYEGTTTEIVPDPEDPYGSYEAPTSIGSGSHLTSGGSGIKLEARSGTVTIGGNITVDGESNTVSDSTSGGASGGSVWVEAWSIDGTGTISADGGTSDYIYGGGGGGGYITHLYECDYLFTGGMTVDGGDEAEEGIVFIDRVKPFFQDKFTGDILNVKWWEIVREPIVLDNYVEIDSTSGDYRQPLLQSLFSISGTNIHTDLDYIPFGADASAYNAYFLLYVDSLNWVGLARKHGNVYGVYSVDGIRSQTAVALDNSSCTLRLRKSDSTFSFQYCDCSNYQPQTIYTEPIESFANKTFRVRMGLEKPQLSDETRVVDQLSLNIQDILNKYVTLSSPPTDPGDVSLSVIQGTSQYYPDDFIVQNQQLVWDSSVAPGAFGVPLEDDLARGDIIRIQYATDASNDAVHFAFDNFKVFEGTLFDIEASEPVLFVDSSHGSDYNDGRQLTPLQNLFVATAWAKQGSTIVLYDGTHNPTEIIYKNLTVRGANGADATITSANSLDTTGSGWENTAISYHSCQGRIHNLTLSDTSTGVRATNTQNLTIFGCTINGSDTGIEFVGQDRSSVVRGNDIYGSQIGVDYSSSFDPTINSNVIYDTSVAVNAVDAVNITISSNTLDDCSTAVVLDGSSYGVVASNNITNNSSGIYISPDSTPVSSFNNNFYNTSIQYPGDSPDSDASNITSDPLYVSQAGRDYHLSSGSPNIGAGTGEYDTLYMDFDRANRSLVGTVDIGAYEFIDGTHSGSYYVGDGDDYVNFGNQSDPFRTLDKATSVADASIVIDVGHYDSYYLQLTDQTVHLHIYDLFQEVAASYLTVSDNDMTNKSLPIPGYLPGYGVMLEEIAVNPVDGPSQYLGTDFTYASGAIFWDGMGMDGIVTEGDVIRIISNLRKRPMVDTLMLHSHFSDLNLGQAIYVSSSGSDSTTVTGDGTHGWGNGTFDHPYRTIGFALSNSVDFDNIVVLAGEYPFFDSSDYGTFPNGATRVLVPANDRTSVSYNRYMLQDYFVPRDFREFNHIEYDSGLWDFTYSPDSSVQTGSGYLEFTYDGTHDAIADSIFQFSGDYEVAADLRNAVDPVFFSLYSPDNTATFQFNDASYVASIITDGTDYFCHGTLDLTPAIEDQYFTEYLCVDSDDTRNGYASLSYVVEDCTVALNAIGGVAQEYGVDFRVHGEKIIWAGMGMDGDVVPGELMRVIYRARGLSDTIHVRMSVKGGIFEARAYNYDTWQSLVKRDLVSGLDGTWTASFYMDEPATGQSHICKSGKGYASKFSLVADYIEGSTDIRDYAARTNLKPVILHKDDTIPGAPIQVSPDNDATDVSLTPAIIWSASDGADRYNLQVSTLLNFGSLTVDQTGLTGLTYTTPVLASDSTYYWRVSAENESGISAWSVIRNFVTG